MYGSVRGAARKSRPYRDHKFAWHLRKRGFPLVPKLRLGTGLRKLRFRLSGVVSRRLIAEFSLSAKAAFGSRGQAPHISDLAEQSRFANAARWPPILKSAEPDPGLRDAFRTPFPTVCLRAMQE